MESEAKALTKVLVAELEEYKGVALDLSKRLGEALDVIDMLVNLHRETANDLDRCCNIFEILLKIDNEINTEEMMERFR